MRYINSSTSIVFGVNLLFLGGRHLMKDVSRLILVNFKLIKSCEKNCSLKSFCEQTDISWLFNTVLFLERRTNFYHLMLSIIFLLYPSIINKWRSPYLSELSLTTFNVELTHLGSEAFKYYIMDVCLKSVFMPKN